MNDHKHLVIIIRKAPADAKDSPDSSADENEVLDVKVGKVKKF